MSQSVLYYLVISVVLTEYITGFLKNATIIEFPRNFVKSLGKFFNELLECGYCLSVWVSLFIVTTSLFVAQIPELVANRVVNFLILWVVISSLSNCWHGFKDRYLETYKDARYTN